MGAGNPKDIFVSEFGEVLGRREADAASCRTDHNVEILLGLGESCLGVHNFEGFNFPLDGQKGGESTGSVYSQELVRLLADLNQDGDTSIGSF